MTNVIMPHFTATDEKSLGGADVSNAARLLESGLDVVERHAVDLGRGWGPPVGARVLAVLRDGVRHGTSAGDPIEQGDRLVVIRPHVG